MSERTNNRRQLPFNAGDCLHYKSTIYVVKKLLGEGVYGKVIECKRTDVQNNQVQTVAMKIMGKNDSWFGKKEIRMLNKIKELDGNKHNLVYLLDYFVFQRRVCLVFEKLDKTLFRLVRERYSRPLQLSEIRVMAQQMLVALNALKSINVVHADIKPDNIMLVNHDLQPFKLKLIDFGLAIPLDKLHHGKIIQAVGYRAPEVILGLPLNEAIDMWALGCVLAFLYLGKNLYPITSESEVISAIVQMHGQPDKHMLNCGLYTRRFFCKDRHCKWKLIKSSNIRENCFKFTSLDDLAKTRQGLEDTTEDEDTLAFLSLLKHMLQLSVGKRITASEALQHPFITMRHFVSDNDNGELAKVTTENCQLQHSSVKKEDLEKERKVKGRGQVKSIVTHCRGKISTTSLDDLFSVKENALKTRPQAKDSLDDRTAEGTALGKKRRLAKVGSHDAIVAGTTKKRCETNEATSPAFAHHEINASSGEGFVEVKTKKKWYRRICGFFRRIFKFGTGEK